MILDKVFLKYEGGGVKLTPPPPKKKTTHILLISETKIDESFPDSQFKIDGFSNPHRVDLNDKGGGTMLLFREDLPVKVLSDDKGNESCYVR